MTLDSVKRALSAHDAEFAGLADAVARSRASELASATRELRERGARARAARSAESAAATTRIAELAAAREAELAMRIEKERIERELSAVDKSRMAEVRRAKAAEVLALTREREELGMCRVPRVRRRMTLLCSCCDW